MTDDHTPAATGTNSLTDGSPDEHAVLPEAEAGQTTRDTKRLRIILSLILVVLAFLLAGVGYYLYTIVNPVGGPGGDDGAGDDGLVWVRSIYGWGDDEANQLVRPTDTAIGPDGTIWIAEGRNDRVLGYSPSGELRQFIHFGPRDSSPQALNRPDAVDVDDDGNVYIANLIGEKISVATPDNALVREFSVPAPLEVTVGDEFIVVGSKFGVGIHDLEGKEILILGAKGAGEAEFDGPRGIVIGDDGTIYVTELHNRRLKAYTRDGALKYVSQLPGKPERPGEPTTTVDVQLPAGMTIDGQDRLVYVDPFAFTINVVDPEDGSVIASYGEFGERDGRFFYPTGISYDPARDWFAVADTNNDRVQIVRIPGSGANPLLSAGMRLLSTPLVLCCFPLILLLIAVGVLVWRRRRGRPARSDAERVAQERDS